MSKGFWVIIFLIILAAILAVVAGTYYLNFGDRQPKVPKDLPKTADIDKPVKLVATDEQLGQLESQLKDSEAVTRFDAIIALNALAEDDPQRVGPIVVRALSNQDPKVRGLAVTQLGIIKYAPAARGLVGLLDDEDKVVAIAATNALAKLGDEGLKTVMEGLSKNKIKDVDRALAVARRITGESFGQGQEGREEALQYWKEQKNRSTKPAVR